MDDSSGVVNEVTMWWLSAYLLRRKPTRPLYTLVALKRFASAIRNFDRRICKPVGMARLHMLQ